MQTYNDRHGRTWNVTFSLGETVNIKRQLGIELSQPQHVIELVDLRQDPERLGKLLWHFAKSEAAGAGIDEATFYGGLDADALQTGWQAIVDEFTAFCPADSRETIGKTIAKYNETLTASTRAIVAELESPEFQKQMNDQISSIVKESFTSAFAETAA